MRPSPTPLLLAVDPSLTCSGWALFNVKGSKLVAVGKLKSLPPGLSLSKRLSDLQTRVGALLQQFDMGEVDYVVCEAPTTMRDPRAALKVEQVRCIFETSARARNVQVPGRINPRSVHFEVLGLRGRQQLRAVVKSAAVQVVKNVFKSELLRLNFPVEEQALRRHQDIVDAILIGSLAVSRVSAAVRAKQDVLLAFEPRSFQGRAFARSRT